MQVCCSLEQPNPLTDSPYKYSERAKNLTRETKRHFLSSRSRNDGTYTFCFISRIPALCAHIHILTRLVLSRVPVITSFTFRTQQPTHPPVSDALIKSAVTAPRPDFSRKMSLLLRIRNNFAPRARRAPREIGNASS